MARLPSAGLLLFRRRPGLEVLLGHMGGPFWARKDDQAWSIPKGEYTADEDPFVAARREFAEEMGSPAPDIAYLELGTVTQSGGKQVTVWAGEAEFEAGTSSSNSVTLEWPRGSGRMLTFPEIDRAEWFGLHIAQNKLVKGQTPFLARLVHLLEGSNERL